jgi:hypothetical protein
MAYESGLVEANQCAKSTGSARRLSIAEELQVRRGKLVEELAEVDKSIELFAAHPEFEQCLTQLARVGIYR